MPAYLRIFATLFFTLFLHFGNLALATQGLDVTKSIQRYEDGTYQTEVEDLQVNVLI